MEYIKVWVFFFFIAVVAGGFSVQQHLATVDRLNAEVLSIRGNVGQTQAGTDRLKQEWAKLEALSQRLQSASSKVAGLQEQRDGLKTKVRSLEADFKYLVSSVRDTVEKVRANAPGETFDEVALTDGRVLKTAKIRKLEDSQISFIHSEGIATINHDILPESIRQRFDLAPDGLLVSMQQAEKDMFSAPAASPGRTSVAVAPSSPSTTTTTTTSSSSSGSGTPPVDEAKVKAIRLKIVDIDTKIASLNSSVASFERQAADLYVSGDMAKARGTPASKYWTAAERAKAQAEAIKSQIIGLKAEREKLRIDLEAATKQR